MTATPHDSAGSDGTATPRTESAGRPAPLTELSAQGVSVWLDGLSRELLAGGRLQALIRDRRVVGVTTNPTIFAAALADGDWYGAELQQLAADRAGLDAAVLALTATDVRNACDLLREVYDSTDALDGQVSIQADPRLAGDSAATLSQARELWAAVNRPNLLVTIAATEQGLQAITAAVAAGISVNASLICSLQRYRDVQDAYLTGLEQALTAGRDLDRIHAVASLLIAQVDTEVDAQLTALDNPGALVLKGKAAIANAQLAYELHEQVITSDRWQHLAAVGGRPQRPLWAATDVQDPAYPDTMYVSRLVATGSVHCMTGRTLQAFADHGAVPHTPIRVSYDSARAQLAGVAAAGIDLNHIGGLLQHQALDHAQASWHQLGATVTRALDTHPPHARDTNRTR